MESSSNLTQLTSFLEKIPSALVLGKGLTASIAVIELKGKGFEVIQLEFGQAPGDELYCCLPGFDFEEYKLSVMQSVGQSEVYHSESIPMIDRDGAGFKVDIASIRDRRFDVLFFAGGLANRPCSNLDLAPLELFGPETKYSGESEDVALLMDYPEPSDSAAAMSAIVYALENAKNGGRSAVILDNVPVRHLQGESLYDSAKSAGVKFYRLGQSNPKIQDSFPSEGGNRKIWITLQDRIEQGSDIQIVCDRLFLVTGPDQKGIPYQINHFLGADLDPSGFLISESIHSNTFKSFSAGVYTIGNFTGNSDLFQIMSQAKAAAASARAYALFTNTKSRENILSISEECVRCLTCYRICPHMAIWPSVSPSRSQLNSIGTACFECGICVSECPRTAIDLTHFPQMAFSSFIEDIKNQPDRIVVYGCSRSAGRAASHISLPPDVVFFSVPCAGRVSESVILETLSIGVKGLLVIGCHHGNCASNNGTDWACDRVETVVTNFLLPMDMQGKLQYKTMAPNEILKMEKIIRQFVNELETDPQTSKYSSS